MSADTISISESDTPSGPREVHPVARAARAVCLDVIDLGMEPNMYKEGEQQHKMRLVFETERRKANGRPFTVSRKFTVSLHEKASLRAFLMMWIPPHLWKGKFTTDMVLNRPAILAITHEPIKGKEGEFYAKIQSAWALEENDMPYTPATGEHAYKRFVKEGAPDPSIPANDDEVPF